MKIKKYFEDYKKEEYTDEKGRVRIRTVYCGAYFAFSNPEILTGFIRMLMAVSVFLCWPVWIFALIPDSLAERTLYTVGPFLFASVALLFASPGAFGIAFGKEAFTREKADEIKEKLPAASLALLILSGISLIGMAVLAASSFPLLKAGDIVFALCDFILLLTGLFYYRTARKLKIEKTDNESRLN